MLYAILPTLFALIAVAPLAPICDRIVAKRHEAASIRERLRPS